MITLPFTDGPGALTDGEDADRAGRDHRCARRSGVVPIGANEPVVGAD